jgi:hypothetical protein
METAPLIPSESCADIHRTSVSCSPIKGAEQYKEAGRGFRDPFVKDL